MIHSETNYWHGDVNINVIMPTTPKDNQKEQRFKRVSANLYPISYEFEDFEHLLEILGECLEHDVLEARFPDCMCAFDNTNNDESKRAEYEDIHKIYHQQIKEIELFVTIRHNFVIENGKKITSCDYQRFSLNYLSLLNYLKFNTKHYKPLI